MEVVSLSNIIKSYPIEDIEKHVVYQYLVVNGISFASNQFLSNYFDGFSVDSDLLGLIKKMGHDTLSEISVDMELLIPDVDKKVNGAFFTPSYIVDYIIKTIAPKSDAVVADISCGSGAFLLGIVRYFNTTFGKSIKACIRDNVYGADILDYNVKRSKLLLILMALSYGENVEDEDINVLCGDSLLRDWSMEFDAIVGNPPYVKFQDMDDEMRNTLLTSKWETTSYGTFNLYFAFFELGYKLLKNDGKLGYITPNNYFTSLSGETLRAFFQRYRCITDIVDFDATKVFDVQTYTAITFLQKVSSNQIYYSRIQQGQKPNEFILDPKKTKNDYEGLNVKKWRLYCDEEEYNIKQIENIGQPIGSMFNICVGIATLKDDVYCVMPIGEKDNCFVIQRNGVEYLIEKAVAKRWIKISEVKTQDEILLNNRYIIFPYDTISGKSVAIDEDDMLQRYPNCYNYLLAQKKVLAGRGKGKHVYTPFYAYGRTQGLNRVGMKLLTPTFSKYPRFLFDADEYSVFTNGYGLYCYKQEGVLLSSLIAREENIDVLQKILNSCIMHYYVKTTSVSIEGGYPCYQKNFIERFSIPELSAEEIEKIRKMSDMGQVNKYLMKLYQVNLPEPNLLS